MSKLNVSDIALPESDGWINVNERDWPPLIKGVIPLRQNFKESSLVEVRLDHTLELVDDLDTLMRHVWLACADGAIIKCVVWDSHRPFGMADPAKRRHFTKDSFRFWDPLRNIHHWPHFETVNIEFLASQEMMVTLRCRKS